MFAKIAVICAFALLSVAATEHGPALAKCTRNDPNVNECLRQSIQLAIRSLVDGYAPLSMPALDPLTITTLTLTSPEGPKATLSDYKVVGLKNVVVERAAYTSTGENSFELSFSVLLPKFDAKGMYTMQKGFFGAAANRAAAGPFTFTLDDYRADFVLDGTVSNGFATLTGKSSSFNGGNNANIKFIHSSALLNNALNAAPAGILHAYKTAIDQLHPVLASTFANLLFQKVPFDELFPASA